MIVPIDSKELAAMSDDDALAEFRKVYDDDLAAQYALDVFRGRAEPED